MELIIKLAAQILFLLIAIVFCIYSAMAIYALNTYGKSKSFSFSVSLAYLVIMISLLSWGVVIITSAK